MSTANLIIGDLLFVFAFISILATGGLNEHPLLLLPLLVAAFASCAVRHINHYKATKKIY
jgi:hypothetical protein